jgi:site-specific recombinase XerD
METLQLPQVHLPTARRKNKTISAKTRSWKKAEDQAQEIRDSWDPDNRIGKTTAGRRLEKVKGFLHYCVKMRWIIKNPAMDLKAIKPDESVALPLLSERYEKVIAATYEYDEQARRASDKFGADMRAVIELMRWTGLRIGDALLCKVSNRR